MFIDNILFDGIFKLPSGDMIGTNNCVKAYLKWMENRSNYLEIGSYHGVMISMLASTFPDKLFFAIDPYDSIERKGTSTSGRKELDIFKDNNAGLENVFLHIGTSRQILPQFLSNGYTFDTIFIDGDHNKESASYDIIMSWKLLSKDGVLGLHDMLLPGVHAAIEMLMELERLDKIDTINDVGYFIKNG